MTKTSARQTTPDWLKGYRERNERDRVIYHKKAENLSLTLDASRKFTRYGEVRRYPGWSIIYFAPVETALFKKLTELTENFRIELQKAGISGKFSFLPISTYHITIAGITTRYSIKLQDEIIKGVRECFEIFQAEKLQPPSVAVRGDIVISEGSTIVAPIEPLDQKSLESIYHIRSIVKKKLHPLGKHVVENDPISFNGHISLAYIVQSMSRDEYSKLKGIVQKFDDRVPLGAIEINKMELHRFEDMESWGSSPLQQIQL